MKTTCGKKTTRESSFQEPLFSEHEKTPGSTHSPTSAKRKLRLRKKRAAGHSIDCDSVPPGRASRSESGLLFLSHQSRTNDVIQPDGDHQDKHLNAPTSENHPDSRSG